MSQLDGCWGFDVNANRKAANGDELGDVPIEIVSCDNGSLIRYNQRPSDCLTLRERRHTLGGRFSNYFMNEELADIRFIVKDETGEHRVPAHKMILATGSDVFKAMFYGLLANPELKELELPDVEYVALTKVLQILYTDKADLDASSLVPTLYAAKKYLIESLEKECINYLTWNLSNDTVLMVFSQAVLYDEKELMDLCLNKLYANTVDIINQNSFLDIDYSILLQILKLDDLAIDEVDLYKSVIRWSVKECERREIPVTVDNQRMVLGEAIYHIRFPLMSGDEFAFNVANQQILTNDEEMSIFSYFANPSTETRFSSRFRAPKLKSTTESTIKEFTLNRFPKVEGGRFCVFDQIHKIDFLVLQPIFVTGFGVYGTRCLDGDRILNVELTKAETNESLATAQMKIRCSGKPKIYQIRFKVPVAVDALTVYTVSAEFDGCFPYPTFYGVNGKRILSLKDMEGFDGKDATFIFFKSEKCYLDTGGEVGQIPQILFSLQ